MEKLKTFAEAADLLIKIGLVIAAFLFVDEAQKLRDIQKQQADLLKTQAEHTRLLAEAQSMGRKDDHELTKMIIDLLLKQDKACLSEDQMVLVSFLSEMNDQYNRVKLGDRMIGAIGKSVGRDYDGFVALGRPLGSSVTNFTLVTGSMGNDGGVTDGSVLRSKWSVYLRTNTTNTEEGTNPIIGLIGERQCIRTLEAAPNVRGQTWARVQLVSCPS